MLEIYYGPYRSYGIISYRNKIGDIEATVLPEGIHIDGDYIHGPTWAIRRMLRRIQRMYPDLPITIYVDAFELNLALSAALVRLKAVKAWSDGRYTARAIR